MLALRDLPVESLSAIFNVDHKTLRLHLGLTDSLHGGFMSQEDGSLCWLMATVLIDFSLKIHAPSCIVL